MHIIKKLKITISSIHSCITIKKMENSKENKKNRFLCRYFQRNKISL